MRRNGRLGRILTNAVCCTGAEPCSEWKGPRGRPPRPWAPRNMVLALQLLELSLQILAEEPAVAVSQ